MSRASGGMPGMEMYSPEDLENMREQLGVDPKDAPQQQQQQQQQQQSKRPAQPQYETQLGFLDTIKAMGNDFVNKVKKLFGYGKKTEL